MTNQKGTCKDCPCVEQKDDLFACNLDPPPNVVVGGEFMAAKRLTQADWWCHRGREIMEYEDKVAAFLAQENEG